MTDKQRQVTLSRTSRASSEVVYDLLADLGTHLEWGGKRQSWFFKLLSIDMPDGPATTGTLFTSTGAIPGTFYRWEDRSQVTEATRPAVFEFTTEATVQMGRSRRMEARYLHRYEITPEGNGSRVTYTFRQERLVNPMLRLKLPLISDLTWKAGIPMMMGRGFRNLLRMAEKQEQRNDVIVRGDSTA